MLPMALSVAASACATMKPPPAWFTNPQPNGPSHLYFVGSANSPDQGAARELALQKALYELSVFCGAALTTDFSSVEVEKNGELNQEVALTVDVAGEEITIQEVTTEAWQVGPSPQGYDAFVQVKWPRSQYQRVLAARRAKAKRALTLLLEAQAAAETYRMADAQRLLRETRRALGPVRGNVPLDHPKYANSGLVFDAAEGLAQHLDDMQKNRGKSMSVAVLCIDEGESKACDSRWVGAIRQRVTESGFDVATSPLGPTTTRDILESQAPSIDAATRSSRYVLAVKYEFRKSAEEYGFIFARCGARAVVFDTDANEIRHVTEVKPMKGGHVNYPGAVKKGCQQAESSLLGWIDQNIGPLKDPQ